MRRKQIQIILFFFCIVAYTCKTEKETPNQWIVQTPKSDGTLSFRGMNFINANEGFIIADYSVDKAFHPFVYYPALVKTDNGGVSWTTLNTQIHYPISSFSVIDKNILYACTTNEVFKTINGGNSWTSTGLINSTGGYDIKFLNEKMGIAANGRVYKTADGGKTWALVFTPDDGYYFVHKIFFTSVNVGYIYGGFHFDDRGYGGGFANYANIIKTEDGGDTWMKTGRSFAYIDDMYFIDDETGFVFTQDKELYKTNDGAKNWNLVNNNIPDDGPNSFFYNEREGYIACYGGRVYQRWW